MAKERGRRRQRRDQDPRAGVGFERLIRRNRPAFGALLAALLIALAAMYGLPADEDPPLQDGVPRANSAAGSGG